jgi:hypothetical protein
MQLKLKAMLNATRSRPKQFVDDYDFELCTGTKRSVADLSPRGVKPGKRDFPLAFRQPSARLLNLLRIDGHL